MSSATTPLGMTFGYARVSTADQDEALQLDALKAAAVDRVFVDEASGALESRPALDELISQLRAGDTVVVWRLDRLGRSLRHLIDLFAGFEEHGVAVRSLSEAIDTTTSVGRMTFHLFAAMAQMERDLVRERTSAGLAAARARGRVGGRPTVMPPEKILTARQMYAAGTAVSTIARGLGVSRASVYRALAQPSGVGVRS